MSDDGSGVRRGYIWTRRRITELGLLPATDRLMFVRINNRGQVAGNAAGPPGSNIDRAFFWTAARGMVDLGSLASSPPDPAYAVALNDAGAVTGYALAFEADYHAFLWSPAGGIVDIHDNASNDSPPNAIDASGKVAGNYRYDGASERGFIRGRTGGMRDLAAGVTATVAAMSAGGRIAGRIFTGNGGSHAMTWTASGGLRDIGTLGGITAAAIGANDKGQVIGYSTLRDAPGESSFVWSARDGMVDLNTRLRQAPAGLRVQIPLAISDNGAIVANSNAGLVLLKPVDGRPCGCPHTVGPIMASALVAQGAPLAVSVAIAGELFGANYEVEWDWGDGSVTRTTDTASTTGTTNTASMTDKTSMTSATGTLSTAAMAADGTRRAHTIHSYAMPGSHTVTATIADQSGKRVTVKRTIDVLPPGARPPAAAAPH